MYIYFKSACWIYIFINWEIRKFRLCSMRKWCMTLIFIYWWKSTSHISYQFACISVWKYVYKSDLKQVLIFRNIKKIFLKLRKKFQIWEIDKVKVHSRVIWLTFDGFLIVFAISTTLRNVFRYIGKFYFLKWFSCKSLENRGSVFKI